MMMMMMSPSQTKQPAAYAEPTNGLAIAGFITSLVGLVATGGLLSPIGLILSLVALGKPYGRGWAWAGVILGFLGTCGWVFLWVLFGAAILAAIGFAAVAVIISHPDQIEITRDMAMIVAGAKHYEDRNGHLPANLDLVSVTRPTRLDPWGSEYRYVLDDTLDLGFDLISNGEDGEPNTVDDIYLSRLDRYWEEAMTQFEERLEEVERGDGGAGAANETGGGEGGAGGAGGGSGG